MFFTPSVLQEEKLAAVAKKASQAAPAAILGPAQGAGGGTDDIPTGNTYALDFPQLPNDGDFTPVAPSAPPSNNAASTQYMEPSIPSRDIKPSYPGFDGSQRYTPEASP